MFSALLTVTAAMSLQGSATEAPSPNDIVVTGHVPLDQSTALRTVTDVTVVSNGLQLARFHTPVCPVVAGIPVAAASAIVSRIRATALKVGARVGDAGCDANLMLFFSDDGRQLVSELRIKRPKWFAGLSKAKANLIEKGDGPVRAWAATSVRNQDGEAARDDTEGDGPASLQVRGASFLQQQTRLDIDGSMIVIDRAAAKGRTLDEIADYVAMRGLAMTKPPGSGGVATILSLFNSPITGSHHTLSSFDLGYLRALYRGSGQESAVEERSRIARALSS